MRPRVRRQPPRDEHPRQGEERERPEGEVRVADDDLDDEHQHRTAEVAGQQQESCGRGRPLRTGFELGPVQGDGQARQQEEADDRERGRDQPEGRQDRDQREGHDGEDGRGEQHGAAPVAPRGEVGQHGGADEPGDGRRGDDEAARHP